MDAWIQAQQRVGPGAGGLAPSPRVLALSGAPARSPRGVKWLGRAPRSPRGGERRQGRHTHGAERLRVLTAGTRAHPRCHGHAESLHAHPLRHACSHVVGSPGTPTPADRHVPSTQAEKIIHHMLSHMCTGHTHPPVTCIQTDVCVHIYIYKPPSAVLGAQAQRSPVGSLPWTPSVHTQVPGHTESTLAVQSH